MHAKRGAAKGVSLAKRKSKPDAFDKLSENPTAEELKTAAITVSLADLEERVADVRESWETDSLFEDALEELTADAAVSISGELPAPCTCTCASTSNYSAGLGLPQIFIPSISLGCPS